MVLHYLAYGSNLHPLRLQERVPSARFVDVVQLPGWSLCFHKRGQDGSAKCDIVHTGTGHDVVHAALFRMDANERRHLDRAEGLGHGYDELALRIPGRRRVFAYVAAPPFIDESLQPFDWYRQYVAEGARYHRFPEAYRRGIEAVPAVADPMPPRRAANEALLARIREASV